MNIEMQFCGLAINLTLILFFLRHSKVGLINERIFCAALISNTASIILDIVSVLSIYYTDYYSELARTTLCKLYLIMLVLNSYISYIYSLHDVRKLYMDFKLHAVTGFVAIISCIVISALPISFVSNEEYVYSRGPAVEATYVTAPLFILLTLLTTVLYGKYMNSHRKNAIRIWMILEIIAAVIQFMHPKILLVGFACSIGILILYAELENPEANQDRMTGAFSKKTLNAYLKQLYATRKAFSVIVICTGDDWHMDSETERAALIEMTEFLRAFPHAKLFRGAANDFFLIYPSNSNGTHEIESGFNLDIIRKRYEELWADDRAVKAFFLYAVDGWVVDNADELLTVYQYYREGTTDKRTTINLDKSTVSQIHDYHSMVKEIKQAITDDRIEVFYQPIYSVHESKFVSAEALARMRNAEGDMVMPGKFIPVAEENGLIEQIGERVFEKTCHILANSDILSCGIKYIEVNLSVAQCENKHLASNYHSIMSRHNLSPDSINLEITETSTLTQRHILLDNMHQLREIGCSFSLDDFGTGESNLNYIVDMPVDIVKFDRTMTQEYFRNDRAKVVMSATVRMIKELGLKIVAEGIETAEELESMKALGVDYIQGYYFSKPLPQSEFYNFIQSKN